MSIIIFNSNTDFLNAIDQLKESLTSEYEFVYLSIQLNDLSDVENEINFIRKQYLLTFSGFRSKVIIRVSLKSSYGFKANITYRFKRNSLKLYDELHHNLRLLEWE